MCYPHYYDDLYNMLTRAIFMVNDINLSLSISCLFFNHNQYWMRLHFKPKARARIWHALTEMPILWATTFHFSA